MVKKQRVLLFLFILCCLFTFLRSKVVLAEQDTETYSVQELIDRGKYIRDNLNTNNLTQDYLYKYKMDCYYEEIYIKTYL